MVGYRLSSALAALFVLASCGGGGKEATLKPRSVVLPALSCVLVAKTPKVSAYVGSSGQFVPGFEPAPIEFTVSATENKTPVSVKILDSQFDPTAFTQEVGATLKLKATKIGQFQVAVSVAKANDSQIGSCSTQVVIEGTPAPDLEVLVQIISATGQPSPFASGEPALLRWTATEAESCEIYRDGVFITRLPKVSGEMNLPPLVNSTPVPMTFEFAIKCKARGTGAIETGTASVIVNPVPRVLVGVIGVPNADVLKGGNLVIAWESSFASDCVLADGINPPIPVAPVSEANLRNIQADMTVEIACRDRVGFIARDSLTINVLEPGVSIRVGAVVAGTGQSVVYERPEGQSVLVEWEARDVVSCNISEFGSVQPKGSHRPSSEERKVYRIVCASIVGEIFASIEVKPLCRPAQGNLLTGNPFLFEAIEQKIAEGGLGSIGDAIADDQATADKICQLFQFDRASSHGCTSPPYQNRCGFTSPGDNTMTRFNGTSFVTLGARDTGNRWMASLSCVRTCPQ